jgi:hypothetical protein
MAMKNKWIYVALGYALLLAALEFVVDGGIVATIVHS